MARGLWLQRQILHPVCKLFGSAELGDQLQGTDEVADGDQDRMAIDNAFEVALALLPSRRLREKMRIAGNQDPIQGRGPVKQVFIGQGLGAILVGGQDVHTSCAQARGYGPRDVVVQ